MYRLTLWLDHVSSPNKYRICQIYIHFSPQILLKPWLLCKKKQYVTQAVTRDIEDGIRHLYICTWDGASNINENQTATQYRHKDYTETLAVTMIHTGTAYIAYKPLCKLCIAVYLGSFIIVAINEAGLHTYKHFFLSLFFHANHLLFTCIIYQSHKKVTCVYM